MTLPARILTILTPSRVSFCSRSIHYHLRQQGQDVTLVLVEDTLRLMASRGEVSEADEGWVKCERPKAMQKEMFK